jgi:pimeloyl-ACP methyl ester carboxylesterase
MRRSRTPDSATTPDGIIIAYDCIGAGRDVVLLHGLADDRAMWSGVTDALCPDHRVVQLDFRGHGASTRVAIASLDAFIEDVHTVVEHRGLRAPVLVGHSSGGAVATAYAGRYPTGAVVNIDQPMQFGALAAAARTLEPQLRGEAFAETLWTIVEALGVEGLSPSMRGVLRANRQRVGQSLVLSFWEPLFALCVL